MDYASEIAKDHAGQIAYSIQRGETQYRWAIDDATLQTYIRMRGLLHEKMYQGPALRVDDMVRAFRAQFPAYKVERIEDWVDIPHQTPPTRILTSVITVDWS